MLTAVAAARDDALGRIAIAICRDYLDLELRVALESSEPTVDVVLDPAFSPVSADFRAAHSEARRALYACTAFCNFAVFGGSCLESPEKAAPERAHRRFIPSTRR